MKNQIMLYILVLILVSLLKQVGLSETWNCRTPSSANIITISGKYGYVALGYDDTYTGLAIIDISDPSSPNIVSNFATSSHIKDVVVKNNYAYITTSKIYILDISNPLQPVLISTFDTYSPIYNIVVENDYAFIANYNRFAIIDISTKTNPIEVAAINMSATCIKVKNQYAIVADGIHYFCIVDISTKTNPMIVGFSSRTWSSPDSIADIEVNNNYVYLSESGTLNVFDISSPTNPRCISSSEYGSTKDIANPLGMYISENYLFVAYYQSGLVIYDISQPDHPQFKFSNVYDTPGQAKDVSVLNGYVFIADGLNGIEVAKWNNIIQYKGGFENVIVYPNPCKLIDNQKHITFKGLPIDASVNIFNISGDKIKQANNIKWEWKWDLSNDYGSTVASGIYLYYISDRKGIKSKGKIAVIK